MGQNRTSFGKFCIWENRFQKFFSFRMCYCDSRGTVSNSILVGSIFQITTTTWFLITFVTDVIQESESSMHYTRLKVAHLFVKYTRFVMISFIYLCIFRLLFRPGQESQVVFNANFSIDTEVSKTKVSECFYKF